MSAVFAILGKPVAHSLSPVLYTAAFADAGIDAVYVRLQTEAEDVRSVMRTLDGGNVTVPHKGVAASALDRATARVKRTRACNTFWKEGAKLYGDNTDTIGFAVALRRLLPDPAGARVLVVGAGGAARAAVYALLEDDVDEITVIARSKKRRSEIEDVAGRRARRVHVIASEKKLAGEGFDLVVNATPLGLRDRDALPIEFHKLGGLRTVFDMVYRRDGTDWVRRAASYGIPAIDGTEMLIQQAAAAFEIWTGADAPVAAMRKALRNVAT